MSNPTAVVQKLWNYSNILRDDGFSYGDYVKQLTFLLFLKMADEQSRSRFELWLSLGITFERLKKNWRGAAGQKRGRKCHTKRTERFRISEVAPTEASREASGLVISEGSG